MSKLFTAACMNQASQNQGLGQGAGLFVAADSAMGAGFYASVPAMLSPMASFKTDPEKVPPDYGGI